MLLRKYRDSKTRLGLGQLFGIAGIVGLVASGTLGNASVLTLFMEQSRLFDFLRGFMTGISGVLLGLALVFNVAGLASKRNERSNNR
jgi:hypothetical protein